MSEYHQLMGTDGTFETNSRRIVAFIKADPELKKVMRSPQAMLIRLKQLSKLANEESDSDFLFINAVIYMTARRWAKELGLSEDVVDNSLERFTQAEEGREPDPTLR
jgi:hypothetical protein